MVHTTRSVLSTQVERLYADRQPSGTATITDHRMEIAPILAETGNFFRYVIRGHRPVLRHFNGRAEISPQHVAQILDQLNGKRLVPGRIFY